LAPVVPAIAAPLPTEIEAELAEGLETTEQVAAEGEEPRRRRRRGGRNRNRRDREGGEVVDGAVDADADSTESTESTESNEITAEGAETATTAEVQADAEASPVKHETARAGNAPAVQLELSELSAPQAETQAAPAPSPAVEERKPEAVAAEPVRTVEAEVLATPAVQAPSEPLPPSTEVPAVSADAEPAPVEEAPAQIAPAPVARATPTAMPAPAAMDLDRLQDVLAGAGLTLAVTDPEKLRAAQQAAQQVAPAPHVPRQRKPLPPPPSEPLVQVETRQ